MPTKRSNVIADVIKAIAEGRFKYSNHALAQMKARDIQVSDIEESVHNATREEHKDEINKTGTDWKYVLRGLNENGDKDIRTVVDFKDPDVVLITAIDKNK